MAYYAHETAVVEQSAAIGEGTRIWHFSHVRGKARIGRGCNLGQSVFVDDNAVIGNYCKLQNNVNVYDGVTLEDYVFCGPSMTFSNVKLPRCEYPREKGSPYYFETRVGYGASIGANVTVVCGVTIGKFALIGSGAVVMKDVPDYAIAVGNPIRRIGWACRCGEPLKNKKLKCPVCGRKYVETGGILAERKEE